MPAFFSLLLAIIFFGIFPIYPTVSTLGIAMMFSAFGCFFSFMNLWAYADQAKRKAQEEADEEAYYTEIHKAMLWDDSEDDEIVFSSTYLTSPSQGGL